jgi:hypothetical protein
MTTTRRTATRPSIYDAAAREGLRAEPGEGLAIRLLGQDDYEDGTEREERAADAAGYELWDGPESDGIWMPVEILDAELRDREARRRVSTLRAALRTTLLALGVLLAYCLGAPIELALALSAAPVLSAIDWIGSRTRRAIPSHGGALADRARDRKDDAREEQWRALAERLYLRLARCRTSAEPAESGELPDDLELRRFADAYRRLSREAG